MLKGKNIVLGVTGCIALYKSCEIVSRLVKLGANVDVIMTQHATEFVQPLSFETLSNNRVICDMFNREFDFEVEHVSLAKKSDLFLVAPATANIIGKFAGGIADDMLTTTFLACKGKKMLCPAMNTNMYENQIFQDNLKVLKNAGCHIITPTDGRLACGDVGKGKMAEPVDIVTEICNLLVPKQDYAGKNILITAGSTKENIDGIRYITNHSSGKMGVELAKACINRGAQVTMIVGSVSVALPINLAKQINVVSTQDMYDAVMENVPQNDIIIKAAAPGDYHLVNTFKNKVKGEKLVLELVKNPDIAEAVGKIKNGKKLVVFCAETENLRANALAKLKNKNADMVVANDVTKEGAGFNVDTNIVTIAKCDGSVKDYNKMLKSEVADVILDELKALL
ncbi:MAG: bifunctional phosphopantothenoylcysteine decarboxylase/phosphopantothenate--cysteine ligase CoaBC [Clostridia bacterium]